ncbi:MAG: 7-cyano-7-deazaguanine synthase QueC [Lentisphaeria bacterium]
MKSVTVLTSGGLDSTVLLYYVIRHLGIETVFALSFSYGQKHAEELESAVWQCCQLPEVREHRIIDIGDFGRLIKTSTLIVEGDKVPDLRDIDEAELAQPSTYVPNRNMIFLSIAAAFAESHNCEEIYYAAQAHDLYSYWDCTSRFVEKVNAVLALNRKHQIRVKAPFVDMPKSAVVKLGAELGVDFAKTWSCYRGGEFPCGECPTCCERKKAFREVNLKDPLWETSSR